MAAAQKTLTNRDVNTALLGGYDELEIICSTIEKNHQRVDVRDIIGLEIWGRRDV